MNSFIMAHKRKKSESSGGAGPLIPDLVSLGILTKPISEFSNSDIGTTVLIPYTDSSSKILLNNGCIEFEVVGVNHHTSSEHSQTITLMTKNLIRYAAFDAKEPNNPDTKRQMYGNGCWGVSNIRQWLNSSGDANLWWSKQHAYDAAPNADNVPNTVGVYADAPGFLKGFSHEVLEHLTDITNITALYNVDGGGSETTTEKVFLPSYTEMGYGNINGIAEGSHLSVRFPNDNSRIKSGAKYWMRSLSIDGASGDGSYVSNSGSNNYNSACNGNVGIAPIIVLH